MDFWKHDEYLDSGEKTPIIFSMIQNTVRNVDAVKENR